MESIKHLLREISILNQSIKEREKHEDHFNLFDLMCKRYDEVYLHSRFLSVLLDPQGSHKMKDTFVRLFVEELDLPFKYNLSSLEVYPNEKSTKEHKEIDILLIDRKLKSAVIIENKIRANDSNHDEEGQIERYYRIITQDEGIPAESTSVIYLSINRNNPTEESIATSGAFPELREKILNIHYGDEILNWLKQCVKESYNRPILRESINQYISLIENMTNNDTIEEDRRALMSLVGKNSDNLRSAKFLLDNMAHLQWLAIFEFWKLLSEKLVELGYIIRQPIENKDIDRLVHQKKNRSNFNLKLTTPDGINFTINADNDDNICVGVDADDLNSGEKNKAKSFYKSYQESLNLDACDNWPFYMYVDFPDSEGLFLGDFSNDLTFSLVSADCRKEIVDTIVNQTKKLLRHYKRHLSK